MALQTQGYGIQSVMDESGQWYGNQVYGGRFMETDMEGIWGHRGVMCSEVGL